MDMRLITRDTLLNEAPLSAVTIMGMVCDYDRILLSTEEEDFATSIDIARHLLLDETFAKITSRKDASLLYAIAPNALRLIVVDDIIYARGMTPSSPPGRRASSYKPLFAFIKLFEPKIPLRMPPVPETTPRRIEPVSFTPFQHPLDKPEDADLTDDEIIEILAFFRWDFHEHKRASLVNRLKNSSPARPVTASEWDSWANRVINTAIKRGILRTYGDKIFIVRKQ